jgi:sterol desaturase/sphingolipid hydroxylase (fatty acid hydroxylase superfamily)
MTSIENFVESNEVVLRLASFAGLLCLMAICEALLPKKTRSMKRNKRWLTNLGLVFIDSFVLRLLTPILAAGVAMWAQSKQIGILNWLQLPLWFEYMLAFLLLDLFIYVQHVMSHKVPMLWAFHKVHHADRDIDVTTGLRFHPVEIVFSMLYKLICVVLLGPAATVVILFEIVLNGAALFNHANVALPVSMDKRLRKVIVTPDFHRVHHSVENKETDSNYGFFLSVWDKLFHTYIAQPKHSHDGMTIGLKEYQSEHPKRLMWCLTLPWNKNNE